MKPLLLAAAIALLAPTPPFPPPRLLPPSPDLRCDFGAVDEHRAEKDELVLRTDAGALTLRVGDGVKVVDADGKPLASVADLRRGQRVRAYYVVQKGARLREVDVER